VYKEKKRWKELYKFLSIDNKIVIILINNNLLYIFKSTFIRPFKTDNFSVEQKKEKLPKVFPLILIIILNKEP